jgi:hypothetical protein
MTWKSPKPPRKPQNEAAAAPPAIERRGETWQRLPSPAMSNPALLFRCKECGWSGEEKAIIQFPDPDQASNLWNICPECRSAESFENVCDEPGCTRVAGCGWPSPSGYRRTCYEHMKK